MLDLAEFITRAGVNREIVETWVAEGWLRPHDANTGWAFSEMDVARALLIRDLHDDMGVNDEGVAIILDLVDQMHVLRRRLREFCQAFGVQPPEAQQNIAAALRQARARARRRP